MVTVCITVTCEISIPYSQAREDKDMVAFFQRRPFFFVDVVALVGLLRNSGSECSFKSRMLETKCPVLIHRARCVALPTPHHHLRNVEGLLLAEVRVDARDGDGIQRLVHSIGVIDDGSGCIGSHDLRRSQTC
jgi:hypothetical protein